MGIFRRRRRTTHVGVSNLEMLMNLAYGNLNAAPLRNYFDTDAMTAAATHTAPPITPPRGDDIIQVTFTRTQAETVVRMLLAHSDNSKLVGAKLTSDIARQLAGFIDYETGVQ